MNEQMKLSAILDEKIAACAAKARSLELDHRRDEAVFEKIRMNVYDIFRTVFRTAQSQPAPDAFFLEKLAQIPENWRVSLDQAKQHGNTQKAHIEQIKLDTAAEIRSIFRHLQEEQS